MILSSEVKKNEIKKMHGPGNDFIVVTKMNLAWNFDKNFIGKLRQKHHEIGNGETS